MVQVSLSTSTNFDGSLNALVEDQGTALTVRFDLDEPAPAGGLKVYIDSDTNQILNRLDLPGAIANPQFENLNLLATQTNFDNSGLAVSITEGSTFATVTLNIFDNIEPDTFLPATFDGLVETTLSLVTADQVAPGDQNSITNVSDYTIDPAAASSTVLFADTESQLPGSTPEPPVNSAPIATDDSYTVITAPGVEDPNFEVPTELTVDAAAGVLTNDTDADGDDLTVAIAAAPTNGSVTLNGDGSFTYTPTDGFSTGEQASFTYTVSDGSGGSDTGNVVIEAVAAPTPPPTDDPIVSFEAVPATISEEGTAEERLLRLEFTVAGEIPEGGLVVLFENLFGITDQADSQADGAAFEGLGLAPPFDQENNIIGVRLLENQAAIQLPMINDLVEETTTFDFRLLEGDGYTLDPDQNSTLFTITDDNGGPGVGPTIGLSVSETNLAEGDTFTVNFAVDGTIPAGGIDVLVTSDESVAGPLGQFDLANLDTLQLSGVSNLRPGDDRGQGFIATITEASASITLAVFDDIIAEEPIEIPFTLANGELYEVDPNAENVTLTVSDEPQPVGPTVSLTVDETTLVEGGDPVTLTIAVDGEIPAEGLQVLINDTASAGTGIRSLTEFDVANVTTTGIDGFPSPAEGDSGFFVTVTEPTATITLAAADDGADEDEAAEAFTFEVIDGEAYEVDGSAGSITVTIADASGPTPNPSDSFITPVADEFSAFYSTQSLGRVPLDTGGFVPAGYGGIAFLDDDTLLVTGNPYTPDATIYEVDVTRDAETNSITGFAGPATFFAEAPGIGSLDPESVPEPGGLDGGLIVAPNGTILYTTYEDNSIGQILPGSTAPDAFIDLTALGVEPATGSLEIVPEGSPGEGRLKITSFEGGALYDAVLIENADGTYDITVENTIVLDTPDLFRGSEGIVYVDESNPGFTTDTVLISEYDTNNISAYDVDDLGNPIVDTVRPFLDGLTGSGAGGSFDFDVDPVTGDFLVSYDSAFTADGADQGGRLLLITDETPSTAVADDDPFDNAVALDISGGSVTASGAVSTSNDVYAIDATAGKLLTIEIDVTEALPGIAYTNDDTQLYLYNEAGDVLAFSEDKPDSFASNLFNYLVPETGTYYAAVTTAGNEPILELGQVNQLLGFEETGLANVVYNITVDAQDVPETARLFDIALEVDPGNPVGNVLIDGDEVLFIDLNGSRNTDVTGSLTLEVNAEEVNFPENTLDNTLVFEDTLSFGLDVFDFILDFDEPFASTNIEDIVDSLETSGITAIIPPDELIQRIVFTEQFIDTQVGSDDGETIVGGNFRVSLDGQGGDDTIAGGLGNDLILGGDGDDVLRGDLNERDPQDGGNGGNDIIFGGEGNDRIGGKAGNDILSGDAGDDIIWGDAGDDILMGVTGNDILIGDNFSDGGGSDLFVFGSGDGTDTVLDFEVGIDRIGIVEGEFTFADVTLTQDGINTILGVSTTGETLAVLNNVQAFALGESDFVTVPDVSNPDEALALI